MSGAPPTVENITTTLEALIQVFQPPPRDGLGQHMSNMESLLQPIALQPTPQHHSRPMPLRHGPHLLSPPTARLPTADTAAGTPLQSYHRRHPVPGVHHRTRKHKPATPLPTDNWPGTLCTHPIRRKPQHTRLHQCKQPGLPRVGLRHFQTINNITTDTTNRRKDRGDWFLLYCQSVSLFSCSVSCVVILDSCPVCSFPWYVYFFGGQERWKPHRGGTVRRSVQNL